MDLLTCPYVPVFEVLEDVNLAGSFRSILKPAVPVAVIGKPVLPRAGFEYFVPCFRPGKFVLNSIRLSVYQKDR